MSSIAACAKYLNANQNNESVIPNLTKYLKDKIPNVKFFIIKRLSGLGSYVDSQGKEKIKAAVKELKSDEDGDVKYFSQKFTI